MRTARDVFLHQYTFPPQPLVISACAELAKRINSGGETYPCTKTVDAFLISDKSKARDPVDRKEDKVLFFVGYDLSVSCKHTRLTLLRTYAIGKERIVKGGVFFFGGMYG